MAKGPGRIALYELVNKARFKSAQQKALAAAGAKLPAEEKPVLAAEPQAEPEAKFEIPPQVEAVPHPQADVIEQQPQAEVKPESTVEVKPAALWSARPRPIRIYADRVELCLSWQTAGIAGLVFVVLLLVFFRLGRISAGSSVKEVKPAPVSVSVEQIMPKAKPAEKVVKPAVPQATPKVIEPMGENAIVIASYRVSADLEPVKKYFADFGIATDIIKRGSRYLLVTQNRFSDIEKPGTDGYLMKRKIMSIGIGYKPPLASGFEPFGTKPFQDVYGMKLE